MPLISPLEVISKYEYFTPTREELVARTTAVLGLMADGKLKVNVDKTFALADAKDAHDYLEAGKTTGKVLLKM